MTISSLGGQGANCRKACRNAPAKREDRKPRRSPSNLRYLEKSQAISIMYEFEVLLCVARHSVPEHAIAAYGSRCGALVLDAQLIPPLRQRVGAAAHIPSAKIQLWFGEPNGSASIHAVVSNNYRRIIWIVDGGRGLGG
jgi:hypothetical protein